MISTDKSRLDRTRRHDLIDARNSAEFVDFDQYRRPFNLL
jgi:hypothetical protein